MKYFSLEEEILSKINLDFSEMKVLNESYNQSLLLLVRHFLFRFSKIKILNDIPKSTANIYQFLAYSMYLTTLLSKNNVSLLTNTYCYVGGGVSGFFAAQKIFNAKEEVIELDKHSNIIQPILDTVVKSISLVSFIILSEPLSYVLAPSKTDSVYKYARKIYESVHLKFISTFIMCFIMSSAYFYAKGYRPVLKTSSITNIMTLLGFVNFNFNVVRAEVAGQSYRTNFIKSFIKKKLEKIATEEEQKFDPLKITIENVPDYFFKSKKIQDFYDKLLSKNEVLYAMLEKKEKSYTLYVSQQETSANKLIPLVIESLTKIDNNLYSKFGIRLYDIMLRYYFSYAYEKKYKIIANLATIPSLRYYYATFNLYYTNSTNSSNILKFITGGIAHEIGHNYTGLPVHQFSISDKISTIVPTTSKYRNMLLSSIIFMATMSSMHGEFSADAFAKELVGEDAYYSVKALEKLGSDIVDDVHSTVSARMRALKNYKINVYSITR